MQQIAKYSLAAVGAGISLELLWKIYQKYVTNRKVHISEVVFFNNKHSPEKIAQLTSYIDEAQHLICLAMYQLTSYHFCNALKRAISRGVEIRFIFDCTMEGSSGSEVDNLRNKGEVNLFWLHIVISFEPLNHRRYCQKLWQCQSVYAPQVCADWCTPQRDEIWEEQTSIQRPPGNWFYELDRKCKTMASPFSLLIQKKHIHKISFASSS